jgi:hypothetical protein
MDITTIYNEYKSRKYLQKSLKMPICEVWVEGPSGLIEQHVFEFSLIIEGTTEKVLQFTMPLKSINSKNLCFDEQ